MDLDVRMKAVLLGALFLIVSKQKYTWNENILYVAAAIILLCSLQLTAAEFKFLCVHGP